MNSAQANANSTNSRLVILSPFKSTNRQIAAPQDYGWLYGSLRQAQGSGFQKKVSPCLPGLSDHPITRSPDHPIFYVLGLAFSLTCPFCISTEYSTTLQPYSFFSCSVFWRTNFLKDSRLEEFFSPVVWRASARALNKASTLLGSESTSEQATLNGPCPALGWCRRARSASCCCSSRRPWIPSMAS